MPMQRTSLPPICAQDVFDAGTRRGDATVALLLGVGDALGGAAFALDVDAPACLLERCFSFRSGVPAISINIATGVAAVKERFEYRGVGQGGVGDDHFAHQFVALVHAGMQLVAEVALAVLLRPACVDMLLRAFMGFQLSGMVPSLTMSASSRLLR